ncbi:MAG: stress response translation initiation inhibitor YciH [Candidatus Aenigmatarchaeota archaeon]|nr:MAG: stress response translation initiation inhibitor YciH [Candidatus Aenigmarchaeota archaeon]RLJ08938.1 MAG: stress response translation initiation inhibitor YciH [Candidatus Aenigmarchaeota archaeon]RLJ09296.1 MAG: stress response translation initiation inhibitor YciH [Candidatus Aenigmarchaeota archaeon]
MSKICDKCGLPKELCICETIAKEKEKIRVFNEKKRYGKTVTIIEGLSKDIDAKKILKQMKQKLACGGTIKNNNIELQGEHKTRIKNILISLGFQEDQIEIL